VAASLRDEGARWPDPGPGHQPQVNAAFQPEDRTAQVSDAW
jgi:hypothetical protein